jgi:hypothetical protein
MGFSQRLTTEELFQLVYANSLLLGMESLKPDLFSLARLKCVALSCPHLKLSNQNRKAQIDDLFDLLFSKRDNVCIISVYSLNIEYRLVESYRDHYRRVLYEAYDTEKGQLNGFIVALLRSLEFLAFLLQNILQHLLIFCKYAEFPNRRRPKCTTMPWNIWPSLVVLWGVCWMFYTPSSHQDDISNQPYSNDEYFPIFHPSKTLPYAVYL